jgi:hypothetical protein
MPPAECAPVPNGDLNGVLATCLTLHSVSMSAIDRDAAELLHMEAYLQRKLDNWTDYPPIDPAPSAFDNTVRALVRIALTEWRACPRHPWAKLCDTQLESLAFELCRVGDQCDGARTKCVQDLQTPLGH